MIKIMINAITPFHRTDDPIPSHLIPSSGKSFVVGCQGASLGRKPTNDIVLSLSIPVRPQPLPCVSVNLVLLYCYCILSGRLMISITFFVSLTLSLTISITLFLSLSLLLYVSQNDSGQGDDDRESVVNIDTAISSDHARIEMDHTTGENHRIHSLSVNTFSPLYTHSFHSFQCFRLLLHHRRHSAETELEWNLVQVREIGR